MLKCPYCIETRPNRSRLRIHVEMTHSAADTRVNLKASVLTARTVTDVVTDLDVQRVSDPERQAEVSRKLSRAGDELHALRVAAEKTLTRLDKLDNMVLEPAAVRRATLDLVCDKLLDVGNISGYTIVRRMITEGI